MTQESILLDGMRLDRLSETALVEHVMASLSRSAGGWVITANLDHMLHRRVPANTALYDQADLVVADGMPLLWAAKLQGTPLPGRVAGSNLVWSITARAADHGRSVYLLGGAPGAASRAARRFLDTFPGLRIAGVSSPRVSATPTDAELASIRKDLQAAAPDIVYVALGAPKQERLIAALRTSLPSAWWLGIGVGLSFVGGDVKRAPVWLQRVGLEWLHRLVQEPRRLARRYLWHDLPFAVGLLARSAMRRARSGRRPSDRRQPMAEPGDPPCSKRL